MRVELIIEESKSSVLPLHYPAIFVAYSKEKMKNRNIIIKTKGVIIIKHVRRMSMPPIKMSRYFLCFCFVISIIHNSCYNVNNFFKIFFIFLCNLFFLYIVIIHIPKPNVKHLILIYMYKYLYHKFAKLDMTSYYILAP